MTDRGKVRVKCENTDLIGASSSYFYINNRRIGDHWLWIKTLCPNHSHVVQIYCREVGIANIVSDLV